MTTKGQYSVADAMEHFKTLGITFGKRVYMPDTFTNLPDDDEQVAKRK